MANIFDNIFKKLKSFSTADTTENTNNGTYSNLSNTGSVYGSLGNGAYSSSKAIQQDIGNEIATNKIATTTPNEKTTANTTANMSSSQVSQLNKSFNISDALQNSLGKSRDEFDTDDAYERYLVDNKVDVTRGNALKYIREQAKNQDTTIRDYAVNMHNTKKATLETEDLEQKAANGEMTDEQLEGINSFGVVVDKDNKVVDSDTYKEKVEKYNLEVEKINNEIEKLNLQYQEGKIDDANYQVKYNEIVTKAKQNDILGEELSGYSVKQGFDYYNWAKENGQDVTDFEKYAESMDDSWLENLGELYSASLIDTANILPQTIETLRTLIDSDYDMTDENSLSSKLTAQANELRTYAYSNTQGFEQWSLQTLDSLMPMINANMIFAPLGLGAKALGTASSALLGVQTAGQVARQRLEEGCDSTSAVVNGALHGAITFAVEALNAGEIGAIFTGEAEKHLVSNALFGKLSAGSVLKYLNSIGIQEGKEEIIEAGADWLADTLQNEIMGAINGDTIKKIEVEDLDPSELANQFVMAYAGAVLLGTKSATSAVINSNMKYNAALEAKKSFESTLNDPKALEEEKAFAKECIAVLDNDMGNYQLNKSNINSAITSTADQVAPTATFNELQNMLANALRPTIQNQLSTAQETLNKGEKLKSMITNELQNRGYQGENTKTNDIKGVSTDTYLKMTPEVRNEAKNILDLANNIGADIKIDDKFRIWQNGELTTKTLESEYNGANYSSDGTIENTDHNIAVNPFSNNVKINGSGVMKSTLAHELLHNIKDISTLKQLVKNKLGESGWKAEENYVKQMWAGDVNTQQQIDEEIVARYIENNFGDEKFLKTLANYDTSLLTRLYNNFKALVDISGNSEIANEFFKAYTKTKNEIANNEKPQLAFSFGNGISNDSKKVNDIIKLSKGTTGEIVGRNKDLMAIHNLSEDKLLKSLNLGGFAMPSIAVTKDSIGHEDYGSISLIFDKSTIDPKNKKNEVFGGDAWTTTYPRIETEIKQKELQKAWHTLWELQEKVDDQYKNEIRNALNEYDGVATTRPFEFLFNNLKDKTSMKAAFLETKGEHVDVEKERRNKYTPEQISKYESVLNEIPSFNMTEEELLDKYGDFLKKTIYDEYINKGVSEEQAQKYANANLMQRNLIDKTLDYQWDVRDGKDTYLYPNTDKANAEINNKINQSEYEQWLKDTFEPIFGEEGVWNGKEYITDNGRRTYKQLFKEANLNNILNQMLKDSSASSRGVNSGLFGAGFGDIRATQTKQFNSLNEIIENEDMIQDTTDESVKEKYQELSDRLYDITYRIAENKPDTRQEYEMKSDYLKSLEDMETASNAVKDIIQKNNIESMRNLVDREYRWMKVSDEVWEQAFNDLLDIKQPLSEMATSYFEAKPRRIVTPDEIKMAVIPNTSSELLKETLDSRDIPYQEYDPNIEGDRKNVTNSLSSLKFSKGYTDNTLVNLLSSPNNTNELRQYLKDKYNKSEENIEKAILLRDSINLTSQEQRDNSGVSYEKSLEDLANRIINSKLGKINLESGEIAELNSLSKEIKDVSGLSKEDEKVIAKARKEIKQQISDSSRRLNAKNELNQVVADIYQTGDISEDTYNALKEKVRESTLIKVPNEAAYDIKHDIITNYLNGKPILEKANWDKTLQQITDTYPIFTEDTYPLTYEDARESLKDYFSSVGDKYNYFTPVQMGMMSQEDYDKMLNGLDGILDDLKYNLTNVDMDDKALVEYTNEKLSNQEANLIDKLMLSDAMGNREQVENVLDYIRKNTTNESVEESAINTGNANIDDLIKNESKYIDDYVEKNGIASLPTETLDKMESDVLEYITLDNVKKQGTQVLEDQKAKKKVTSIKEVAKNVAQKVIDRGEAIWQLDRKFKKNGGLYSYYNQYRNAASMADYQITKKGGWADIINEIPKDQQNDFSYMMYHWLNTDAYKLKKPVFGDITDKQSQQIVDQYLKEHPNWEKTAQKVWDYEKSLREELVKHGRISQETANKWEEMYPHYVHIVRDSVNTNEVEEVENVLETKEEKVKSSNKGTVKERTGGNSALKSLNDAITQQTQQVYKSITMNDFVKEYVKVSKPKTTIWQDYIDNSIEGIDKSIGNEIQEATEDTPATFIYYDGGDTKTVEVPAEIYDAFNPKTFKWDETKAGNILHKVNDIRRNLITSYDPTFGLRNFLKDSQDVIMKSEHPALTYSMMPSAITDIAKNSETYQLYRSLGGGRNNASNVTNGNKLWNNTVGLIERSNNFIETLPRYAEFKASLASGRTPTQAIYDADKVTTNFKMGGDYTKFADRNGFTFLNASVQGLTELARSYEGAYDKKGMKGVLGKMAIATLINAIPLAVLNHLVWKDDEEYEDLSEYIKEDYYIVGKIGDRFIRIPKGRVAAAYQSVIQGLWDAGEELVSDDEGKISKAANEFFDGITGVWKKVGINNPLENNIVSPIIDVLKNETWYDEPLLSDYELEKDESEQYDYSTDKLSVAIGKLTDTSPKKINYILDQYSGGIGKVVLPMLTPKAETGLDDGTVGGKIASAIAAPVVDDFTTDPVFKNQNVTDVYSLNTELSKLASKESASDEEKVAYKFISSIKYEMGKLYGERADIYEDETLTDAEKYRQARIVQQEIDELAKYGLDNYDNIDMVGGYTQVGDLAFYKNTDNEWAKVDAETLEEMDSLNMTTDQRNTYYQLKEEITGNNKVKTLLGYYDSLEELNNNTTYSASLKAKKIAALQEKITNYESKFTSEELAQIKTNGSLDAKANNYEAIKESNLTDEQKNYMYDKYYSSNLNDYINDLDLTDEEKLDLKYSVSQVESLKDSNGNTIKNSKANQIAEIYNNAGVLDDVFAYIKSNGLKASDFGLSTTVYNNYTGVTAANAQAKAIKAYISALNSANSDVFSYMKNMTSVSDAKSNVQKILANAYKGK